MQSINHMVRTGFVFFFWTFALYTAENESLEKEFLVVYVGGKEIRLPRGSAKNFELLDFSLASRSSVNNQNPIELPSSKVHRLALKGLATSLQAPETFLKKLDNMGLEKLINWYKTAAYCVIKPQPWNGQTVDPLDLIYKKLATKFSQSIYFNSVKPKIYQEIAQNPPLKTRLTEYLYNRFGWSKTQISPLEVRLIDCNRDGSRLAVAANGRVKILHFSKEDEEFTNPLVRCAARTYERIANCAAKLFLPGLSDEELALLPLGVTQIEDLFNMDAADIKSMRLSPDGTLLATCSNKGEAQLWETESRNSGRPLFHDAPVKTLYFVDDNTVVTYSADNQITTWNTKNTNRVGTFSLPSCVDTTRFSHHKRLIAALGNSLNRVSLWNIPEGEFKGSLMLPNCNVAAYDLSHGGNFLVVAFSDNSVQLWNVEKRELIRSTQLLSVSGLLLFSPDEKQFSSLVGYKNFFLIDTKTGEIHYMASGDYEDLPRIAVFSQDSTKLFTISWKNDLALWQRRLDQQKISLKALEEMPIEAVADLYKQKWR